MDVNVNSDNRLSDLLLLLKRHLRTCAGCRAAMKARGTIQPCEWTVHTILTAAWQYDNVIPRRIKAAKSKDTHVYACPDIGAHGKSFAMTAEPLIVQGIQEGLL